MDYVPIGKLVKKTKQIDPEQLGRDHFTYIDIASIDRDMKLISAPQRLSVKDSPSRARKLIEGDDILLSTVRPNLNAVAIVPPQYHGEIASTGFCVLRALEDCLNPQYLFYLTQSTNFISHLVQIAVGASYPAVTDADVLQFQIPLPRLEEQKRIAAILEEADHARRTRRFTQSLSDTFLQEVFVEMFGDPVSNPMEWETASLAEVCAEIYRYPTFYGFEYSESGVPVARIGNIRDDGILSPNLSDYVFIEPAISAQYPRTILEMYDTLMAVRGDGSTATRIGLVTSNNLVGANISPNLLRFKANPAKTHPFYLYHLLVSPGGQALLDRYVTRTAKKTITAADIKAIQVPKPNKSAQGAFVHIVEEYSRVSDQQQESERQAEHLFQTLLHRAFRGEL